MTSRQASLPPAHLGMRRSAGLASLPGRRNRPSLTGASEAATAVWYRASRRRLWRAILSPWLPQPRAWSPMMSEGWWHAGHGDSSLKTGMPSRYLRAMVNSCPLSKSPREGLGTTVNQSAARRLAKQRILATSRWPASSVNCWR